MGLQFRKRIKILPGLSLNLSQSGLGRSEAFGDRFGGRCDSNSSAHPTGFQCRLPEHQPLSLGGAMNTLSPFWRRVYAIIEQAADIWPAGAQRDALSQLSQDIQAIEIYAGNIADGETAATVAGRIITKLLYQL
jgi:hypothetical protein